MAASQIQKWILRVAPLIALPLMLVSLIQIFFWVPTEKTLGFSQRIFYWHVPAATFCYVAFVGAGLASVAFLLSRKVVWDHAAHAAVSVGMVFATIVLGTGSIWAHTAWNTWWTPDSRLTTFLVLWLVFASYVLLRIFARDNEMAPRYAAVLAILGAAIIPLVILATRMFNTIHPQVINNPKGGIDDPRMVTTLLVSLAAFLPLLAWLWAIKFAELRAAAWIELFEGDLAADFHRPGSSPGAAETRNLPR
ncbi:MAG TPA: cytochrome c biogenesis protein CcsA [Candidatus Limnocylindrales bacterium]|nr:cytochrome c biogenesis protein CcsA [Candidatus Limnocylindrales bacterium]